MIFITIKEVFSLKDEALKNSVNGKMPCNGWIKPKICVLDMNESPDQLSKNDIDYLKNWINSEYLEDRKLIEMRETFVEDSMLDLLNFLEPSFADRMNQWILDMESHPCPQTFQDIKPPWKLSQPVHKHRYLYMDGDEMTNDTPYALLLNHLWNHSAFHRWLRIWTTLTPRSVFAIGRRFRPGMDYTLATPYSLKQPILNLTLCLTPLGSWGNGEKGGYEVYMEEDKDADSSVYRVLDDPILISHLPTWNTLHVVLRDQGVLRFVKYVSKEVKASRWDFVADIHV
ncbi:hypothetical protein PCK1_001030 [Pneumocystis canis]|nr:hypothetical protein PCK1_001030 [Pneumocystis canis]